MKLRLRVGKYNVTIAKVGEFSLDAGMVFGAVPKTLWGRYATVDEYNRVRLGINVVFLDDGNKRFLIDAGAGPLYKYNEKLTEIWNLNSERVDDVLGLDENDIDYVIFTHLHFDHAGGATVKKNGDYEATFPKALYYVHKEEIKVALNPHILSHYSYFEHDFMPLKKAYKLFELSGEKGSVISNISFKFTGGHTEGHIIIKAESEGEALVYVGDLILTSLHIPLAWVSGIDLCRLKSFREKEALYSEALENRYVLVFPHDLKPVAGRIIRDDKGRFRLEKV